jgi:hypothetical protein
MGKQEKPNTLLDMKLFVNDGEIYEMVDMIGDYMIMRRFRYKEQYGYEPNDHFVPKDKIDFWTEVSVQ